MTRLSANLLLLITAAIWGVAFVFQATALRALSPLWVVAFRNLVALAAILPFALREPRGGVDRRGLGALAVLGAVNAVGAILQQDGLRTASVTNAGFLTSLYVVFTPLIARFALREHVHRVVWPAALLALLGSALLTGVLSGGLTGALSVGDFEIILCAVTWAMQVVYTGVATRLTGRPFLVVAVQVGATALAGFAGGIASGPVTLAALGTVWPELLYLGLLSSAFGFFIQTLAQRHTPAPDAAILLAAEAPFAALAGAAILGERLGPVGWAGCALILGAGLLVQLVPGLAARARPRLRRPADAPSV